MAWFRLASHLHIPVQELQEKTSSSEFVEWMEFLERDMNSFHREDHFLAQIATEVRRSYVKNPKAVKMKPFLLAFQTGKKNNGVQSSESIWMQLLGVKK